VNWTGRELTAEVGPVAHGGHCVSRVDGRVVFVRHALPGETVIARVTDDKGGAFCRADAIEVLHASPHRSRRRARSPRPVVAAGATGSTLPAPTNAP